MFQPTFRPNVTTFLINSMVSIFVVLSLCKPEALIQQPKDNYRSSYTEGAGTVKKTKKNPQIQDVNLTNFAGSIF